MADEQNKPDKDEPRDEQELEETADEVQPHADDEEDAPCTVCWF